MRDYALHAFLLGVSCSIVIGLLAAGHFFAGEPGKPTPDADRMIVVPAAPGPGPEPPLLRDGAARSDGERAKIDPQTPDAEPAIRERDAPDAKPSPGQAAKGPPPLRDGAERSVGEPVKSSPEAATIERSPPDAKPSPGEAAPTQPLRRNDAEPAKPRSDVGESERGPASGEVRAPPPPAERETVEGKPDRRLESANTPLPPLRTLKPRAAPRERIEPLTRRAASPSARRSSHGVLPWLRTLRRSAPSAAPRRC